MSTITHRGDYRARRAADYPQLAEQLDALWHAMDKARIPMVAEFYDPIREVKARYPKPTPEPTA